MPPAHIAKILFISDCPVLLIAPILHRTQWISSTLPFSCYKDSTLPKSLHTFRLAALELAKSS